jgi:hypothetical protein
VCEWGDRKRGPCYGVQVYSSEPRQGRRDAGWPLREGVWEEGQVGDLSCLQWGNGTPALQRAEGTAFSTTLQGPWLESHHPDFPKPHLGEKVRVWGAKDCGR